MKFKEERKMRFTDKNVFQIDTSGKHFKVYSSGVKLYDCISTQEDSCTGTYVSHEHHNRHFGIVTKITELCIYIAELELKLYAGKKERLYNSTYNPNYQDFISNGKISAVVSHHSHFKLVNRFVFDYKTNDFDDIEEKERFIKFIGILEGEVK